MGDVRYFDVDEANRLVPLLIARFNTVRPWAERAIELERQIEADGAAAALTSERDGLIERIRQALADIVELGIEIKAVDGLVDFRARREGREVLLCWRYGEERVGFWHELDTGYAGRQPIDSPDAFERTYLS